MDDLEALRAFGLELADAADAISLPAFLAGPEVSTKADGTPVTAADTAIEELIRDRVRRRFPTHGVLGEEFGDDSGGDGTRWIVDPVDGTANFARHIHVWATLIGVERDGELVASVVSAPALGQRWSATRGGGATTTLGGRTWPVRVSAVPRLEEAHLIHAGLSPFDDEGRGEGIREALRRSWRDRGLGDFWGYMLVAQGSADVMVETGVSVWDLAGPALIVTEAGGQFSDLDGTPGYAGPTALATNGLLHAEMVALLARRQV
jgi:histidinol-phosphatase